MKLFGEYLVEKKIISNDLLVRALIEQLKHLPSIAEVTFEEKLYSSDQLLAIFRLQIENKSGFVESAVQLDLWSSEVSTKVEEHLALLRVPLGQVLVQCGSVPLEKITHALDDFFSEINVPKPSTSESVVQPPLDEPGAEGLSLLHDPFCDLLTPSLRTKLEGLFSIEIGYVADSKVIAQTIEEVHRLKGAARLVKSEESEKLLSGLEGLLDAVLKVELASVKPEFMEKLRGSYENTLRLLWEGGRQKQTSGSLDDVTFAKELQAADTQMQLLSFDLGFLDQKKRL